MSFEIVMLVWAFGAAIVASAALEHRRGKLDTADLIAVPLASLLWPLVAIFIAIHLFTPRK